LLPHTWVCDDQNWTTPDLDTLFTFYLYRDAPVKGRGVMRLIDARRPQNRKKRENVRDKLVKC
jgi:hypothetical protein